MSQNTNHMVRGLGTLPALLFEKDVSLYGVRERKHMSCDVIFGSPSADCRGTGVCKITARRPTQPRPLSRDCQATTGVFSSQREGAEVSVVFFRELLCVNVLRKHLMGATLELREPCPLPRQLVDFLGLQIKTLLPGNYPIEEGAGYYRITFRGTSIV